MNDTDFDDILRASKADRPLPRAFRQQVWRRIENDAASPQDMAWHARMLLVLTKPWGAAAGLVATIAFGVALGLAVTPKEQQAATAYAYSISPFAQSFH